MFQQHMCAMPDSNKQTVEENKNNKSSSNNHKNNNMDNNNNKDKDHPDTGFTKMKEKKKPKRY